MGRIFAGTGSDGDEPLRRRMGMNSAETGGDMDEFVSLQLSSVNAVSPRSERSVSAVLSCRCEASPH